VSTWISCNPPPFQVLAMLKGQLIMQTFSLPNLNLSFPHLSYAFLCLISQHSEVPEPRPVMVSPPPTPTTAARQLDEIMSQLLNFDPQVISSPKLPEKDSPKPSSQDEHSIQNMLENLESDLQKMGISTVPKGDCASCRKRIAGKMITAMGLTWHPEHFVCTHCGEEIGNTGFFERDNMAYCSKDYHNLFSPRCAYCSGPILDQILTALDKSWHPEHFFCAHCGEVFTEEGFMEKEGKAYCRQDFFNLFSPRCGGCNRPVLDNYLSAVNTVWHPECFVCGDCMTPFVNGCFFESEGRPFCDLHYHQRMGTLCHACQKPITGRCISAMGHRFHPEHFVCAFCLKQLNMGIFKEQNGKPYCHSCHQRIFI
uniref:Leupaxin n=1 Tax=Latimeria chalumnae TaxID=7897 RepID=H2ZWN7_LATCH